MSTTLLNLDLHQYFTSLALGQHAYAHRQAPFRVCSTDLVQGNHKVVVQPTALHVCQPVDSKQLKHAPVRSHQQQRPVGGCCGCEVCCKGGAACQQGCTPCCCLALCSTRTQRTLSCDTTSIRLGHNQHLVGAQSALSDAHRSRMP